MLKSLELFGFKSFADRTLFEFSPGITCVVGPNGSGKSNVVDALKWILGDQSAKSLRGKDMSDVIFNGSTGRRASGFAEATLTFDNSQGLLPHEAIEVQVGRRLYQSGESEYLLNQSPVRLKDVRDMFMGTGAGTAAYSIIEQGRVDQILQPNPAARRLVFEEAAGISKFKSRRVEAERRLERVSQNLVRLRDIVDEVETQLIATRSQASKAARYRELNNELQELWTGLAADDYRYFTSQLEEKLATLTELEQAQAELQENLESVEAERHTTDDRISALDDQLLGRERELASTREAIATQDATIHYQSKRRSELDTDVARQRSHRAVLSKRVAYARKELAETEQKLVRFEMEFASAQHELNERESQIEAFRKVVGERKLRVQEQRKTHAGLLKQKNQTQAQLAGLISESRALEKNRSSAQDKLRKTEDNVQEALAERVARQKQLAETEAVYREAQHAMRALASKKTNLNEQRAETELRLNELREARSASEARLAVLEELETRQEGIAIGVRDILRRAETSHFPPWNQAIGLVRDLLEVPLELAPVIEAALGERAQLVAVHHLDPLLDYLNRGPAPIEGRVGFVSLSLPGNRKQLDYTGFPGVYGRADKLVKESERAVGLSKRVLSDTWIVETLDVAQKLARDADVFVRFVTLQGEVLSAARELYVGTVPHESSIVSRKSELRQLRNEIHQLDRNVEAVTQRQSILVDSLSSKSTEWDELSELVKQKSTLVTECSAHVASQVREVQRLEKEYQERLVQVEGFEARAVELKQEIETLNASAVDADDNAEEILNKIAHHELEISEVEDVLLETNKAIKAEQLELAKHEERLSGLRNTQTRLQSDHVQRLEQLEEVQQQLRETLASRRRTDFEILAAESEIATQALLMEGVLKGTRRFFLERDQLRKRRSELAKKEEGIHKQRRKISDAQHSYDIDLQNIRNQFETLEKRIFEEFQTPLKKLVDSGVSAYRLYLSERYGDDVADLTIHGDNDEVKVLEDISEDELIDDETYLEQQTQLEEILDSDDADEADRPIVVPEYADVRDELEARVDRLRRKIKAVGHVNTEALDSLEELETRFNGLSHQLKDLEEAKSALEDIIRRINVESQRIFLETFETIRGHFQELFRKLFGGGDADIILEDPTDVLECGIDIVARPPGKELRSISLLSGGEKTMTAVGMLFAMFKSKPSPYCVLDEVDAALDEANVDRYVKVVKEFVSMTQFIVITHRKRTMTAADVLYGVTMEQAGVSKRMSVSFEEVNDNGEIRSAA